MFCPEGYVTLAEVHEALDQFAWEHTPSAKAKENANELCEFEVPEDERVAYRNWLFCAFLEIYSQDLRIALPTGLVLRTAPWVFDFVATSGGGDDWLGLGQHRTFPDSRAERLSIRPISIVLVSDDDFAIDCSKSGNASDAKILGGIDGLPVCIKLPDTLKSTAYWTAEWPKLLEIRYSSRSESEVASGPSRLGGRPAKVDELRLLYHETFPVGHGDLSKKEVLQKIRLKHDFIASVTTLDRMFRSDSAAGKFHQNPHQNI